MVRLKGLPVAAVFGPHILFCTLRWTSFQFSAVSVSEKVSRRETASLGRYTVHSRIPSGRVVTRCSSAAAVQHCQ